MPLVGPCQTRTVSGAQGAGNRAKDSRRRLLEAGLELLAESSRGDLGRILKTAAVAERAGLHRQTFYLHWRTQAEYVDEVIEYVTDPSVSSQSERLANLAEKMPGPGDDPSEEVRQRVTETFSHWTDDPVYVSRLVLWALHAKDEKVAERLRDLYRTNDRNTAAGYQAIGDQWGLEPRPPFTYESIALLFNALRDGLLLHLTIDPSNVPASFIEDVNLALSWVVTRRKGDPDDAEDFDERFRREVKQARGGGDEEGEDEDEEGEGRATVG